MIALRRIIFMDVDCSNGVGPMALVMAFIVSKYLLYAISHDR